jgi:hypothetical protein
MEERTFNTKSVQIVFPVSKTVAKWVAWEGENVQRG